MCNPCPHRKLRNDCPACKAEKRETKRARKD
jgi:hypothetical protein